MNGILKIMRFAFFHPEQYDEEHIKKVFSEKDYLGFSQFCLGGTVPLAHYIGGEKLKLTQEGVREYHRLESDILQKKFNLLMIIVTIVLAIASIVNIILMLQ